MFMIMSSLNHFTKGITHRDGYAVNPSAADRAESNYFLFNYPLTFFKNEKEI